MIRTIAIASILALTACATPLMSPEQINAASKAKDANVVCVVATGPWGKATTTYVNVDKSTIINGGVSVDDACKVNFNTTQAPK